DKVYEVDLCDLGASQGDARYVVNYRYGRRGASLREGSKTSRPVTLEKAHKLFDSVVVSKTNNGYQVAEADKPDNAHSPTPSLAQTTEQEDPRLQNILKRLSDACRHQLSSNAVKRVVWRAGELRIPQAATMIEQLVGQDDDLLDYCIAWSLGRCGNTQQLPTLATIRQNYGEHFVSAMAREAQLALLEPRDRDAMLEQIREGLPDDLKQAVTHQQTADIIAVITPLLQRPSPRTSDILIDLYALALQYDSVHRAILQLLPTLKPVPNIFKAIRRLFKASEFRQDAPIYAGITHLVDMSFSYYRAYGDSAYDPISRRFLSISKEHKKKTPAFAYSSRTRDYLRRRSWRTLRRLADQSSELYVAFAVEILLTVSDADARAEQVFSYYSYELRSYVSHTHDRFAHLFAFNHILNHHNPQMRLSGNGKLWLKENSAEALADLRCEAYAEHWDQTPQALLRLLMESHCEAVHRFALRALKCNREFVRNIGLEPICAMLSMPYEETAQFALEMAQKRVRMGQIDGSLIEALLQSPLEQARLLAQETLGFNPNLMTEHAERLFATITSLYGDNRLWMRRFCADHPLKDEIIAPLVARLIAEAIQRGRDSDNGTSLIDDITWMLCNSFSMTTRELGFDVIADLLNEASVALQILGAKLLLNHATAVEQQPPHLLRTLLEATSGDVRALGTQLFTRLSDEALLAQPTLILKLALSHEAQVRQAVQPVIHRLAQANHEFAAFALDRLIDALFRAEPIEGFHDDILQCIKESLANTAESIDVNTTWRLLQARSKGAQRYGAHLLERWTPQDFSIRQLGRLAGNPILAVRQWAWNGYQQQVARIKEEARDALVIFDAQWEDTRHFARDYFNQHFNANDWHPELLIAICDSTQDDVQDYGRQLIMRFFDEQQGVNYLLKLSQHPSNKVQLFVSQFLQQYASNNIEHLQRLRYYFMSVLAKVNQARTAKIRIIDFLRGEALKSPLAADFVLELFSRHSVTSAIVDKTACIEMLLLIKQRYPELDSPLNLIETRTHPAVKVV
ncbi:MAG: hypothetical protein P8179_10750, partial [Candidatus Thiodiazotropha sp.]